MPIKSSKPCDWKQKFHDVKNLEPRKSDLNEWAETISGEIKIGYVQNNQNSAKENRRGK